MVRLELFHNISDFFPIPIYEIVDLLERAARDTYELEKVTCAS